MSYFMRTLILEVIGVSVIVASVLYFLIGTPYFLSQIAESLKNNNGGIRKMINKYHSKKVECDGLKFDSKKEAKRYRELMLLERAGKIKDLQTQVKYELIPSQRDISGRVVERPVIYIADFVYMDISTPVHKLIVEDTKGIKTKDYIIKRKLMLYRYGIRINEI